MNRNEQTFNPTVRAPRAFLATLVITLISGLVLTSCGASGGMNSPSGMPPPAPPSAPVVIAGTLSGTATAPQFNQQPIQAAAATITLNGQTAPATRLQPGVVIVGKGTRDSHGISLQSADILTELQGPITSIDLVTATLKVLDTVVTVNALTRLEQELPDHTFSNLALADFAVGDFVSVFGATQAGGSILATRIERESPGEPETPEVRGVVSALDSVAKTFALGAYQVAYGSATVMGTLANGSRVEAKGTVIGTTLTASRVRVEDGMGRGDGREAEASGALTNLNATAKTFSLLTFNVDYSGAMVEGTLAEGATVEVEGAMSATDPTVLIAVKVEVRFSNMGNGASDEKTKGSITALSITELTLTVGEVAYWTDAQTLILDHDASIPFEQLFLGNQVEVRALSTHTNAAGQPYAARVERNAEGR